MNLIALMFLIVGLMSLAYLKRLGERHHLYWGVLIFMVPWTPARVVGLLLIADDAIQHSVQATQKLIGRVPWSDWSPVHRLYVWVVDGIH